MGDGHVSGVLEAWGRLSWWSKRCRQARPFGGGVDSSERKQPEGDGWRCRGSGRFRRVALTPLEKGGIAHHVGRRWGGVYPSREAVPLWGGGVGWRWWMGGTGGARRGEGSPACAKPSPFPCFYKE